MDGGWKSGIAPVVCQMPPELPEGEGAVAQGVFHRFSKLGKGLGAAIGHKQGIIAKTAPACGLQPDAAGANALKKNGSRRGRHEESPQRQNAAKAGRPPRRRHARQQAEKLGVVGAVGGVVRSAAVQRGEAGGVDARRAAQGIHFQAGVVGQNVKGGDGKLLSPLRGAGR